MSSHSTYIGPLSAALRHASETGNWVVVVSPDGVGALDLGTLLVTLKPAEGMVVGRTVLFPNGGRVTVARGSSTVEGTGYQVLLLGAEGRLLPADEIAMHSWRSSADNVLVYGGSPPQVRVI